MLHAGVWYVGFSFLLNQAALGFFLSYCLGFLFVATYKTISINKVTKNFIMVKLMMMTKVKR